MSKINIWELLPQEQKAQLCLASRLDLQEMTLEATSEGWKIRIFSINQDRLDDEVIILISKDIREPIKILGDHVGRRTYHHD